MPCSTLPQVEATRLHARHKEIHEQVLALEDLRPVALDLWNSNVFQAAIPDAGFEIEECRRMLDALADALAQGLQQERIDFASCDTTVRAAMQELVPNFVLELKPPGDDRTFAPFSVVGYLVNFKAVTLLLARSAEERKQLLDTGDFVPPVRGAAPSSPHPAHNTRKHRPPLARAPHSACGPGLPALLSRSC